VCTTVFSSPCVHIFAESAEGSCGFPQGGRRVLLGLAALPDLYFVGISPVLPSRFAAVLCVNRKTYEPEKIQGLLLDLIRFTAIDTARTPEVNNHLIPREIGLCIHMFAADVRIARLKSFWKIGTTWTQIYSTGFRGRVQDARLVPIAGRYSCPRATT
jgi:hypothetical protein